MRHLHVTTGLFARVLRKKPEDAITEVLAALLRSETVGLKVLQALLPDKRERPQQVLTQWRGEDGSRPDLVLYWPGEAVVVEVKFWAPLQPRQRKGYRKVLAQLKREVGSATLCFLVPETYREKRVGEEDSLERKSILIFWEKAVKALASIGEGTQTERVWLQELIEAIRQEGSLMHQPRQITQSELDILSSKETAPAIANCLALVDALQEFLASPGQGIRGVVFDRDCFAEFEPEFAYSFYAEPVGWVGSCVGFNMQAWRLGYGGPIGVELWRHEQQELPPTIEPPADGFDISYEDGTRTIWIPLRLSVEEPDVLLQDLRDQIANIYEDLLRR
jgi:hypothetical protein